MCRAPFTTQDYKLQPHAFFGVQESTATRQHSRCSVGAISRYRSRKRWRCVDTRYSTCYHVSNTVRSKLFTGSMPSIIISFFVNRVQCLPTGVKWQHDMCSLFIILVCVFREMGRGYSAHPSQQFRLQPFAHTAHKSTQKTHEQYMSLVAVRSLYLETVCIGHRTAKVTYKPNFVSIRTFRTTQNTCITQLPPCNNSTHIHPWNEQQPHWHSISGYLPAPHNPGTFRKKNSASCCCCCCSCYDGSFTHQG